MLERCYTLGRLCCCATAHRTQCGVSRRLHTSLLARYLSSTRATGRPDKTTPATSAREYFYYINVQGHLYCVPKAHARNPTGPTHLRDARFLDFFFKRLKENDTGRYRDSYPFLSMCAGEYNFVRVAEKPIVFHSLRKISEINQGERSSHSTHSLQDGDKCMWRLVYAASLTVVFDPKRLRVTKHGRLLHPSPLGYGLISYSLVEEWGESVEIDGQDENGYLRFQLHFENETFKLKPLD